MPRARGRAGEGILSVNNFTSVSAWCSLTCACGCTVGTSSTPLEKRSAHQPPREPSLQELCCGHGMAATRSRRVAPVDAAPAALASQVALAGLTPEPITRRAASARCSLQSRAQPSVRVGLIRTTIECRACPGGEACSLNSPRCRNTLRTTATSLYVPCINSLTMLTDLGCVKQ
jgi:hypothetical protein